MVLNHNPSDGAANDLSDLKTFSKRDIIHLLQLILSPIPFIAEPDVISSPCLTRPFISLALSNDFFLRACLYHEAIVVYSGTLAVLYCCLEMPELRGRNSSMLQN